MKKILFVSGSNSSTSINTQLINYCASLFPDEQTRPLNLSEMDIPMFGVDLEGKIGLPEAIVGLCAEFNEADAVVVSTPEHNANPPAFFKNVLDWLSRVHLHLGTDKRFLEGKPVLLMSASTGRGAALKARELVKALLERGNASIVAEFALPSFNHTFENGIITDEGLNNELIQQVDQLKEELK